MEIRILVVSDRVITCQGITAILQERKGFTVVGTASTTGQAVCIAAANRPDLVLFEDSIGRNHAEEFIKSLSRALGANKPALLVLADLSEIRAQHELMDGVSGILSKHSSPDHLCAAIRMVAAGYSFYSNSSFAQTLSNMDGPWMRAEQNADRLKQLTPREFNVLQQVAQGHSSAEISRNLSVSESTVKSHTQNMLTKLGLRNRVHAVIYAHEIGMVHAQVPSPRSF